MKTSTTLKWITGVLEALLGIPILGGLIVVSLLWTPLILMLILHIITLIYSIKDGTKRHGSILGVITSLIGWIPFVGMIMHIITAVYLMVDAFRSGKKRLDPTHASFNLSEPDLIAENRALLKELKTLQVKLLNRDIREQINDIIKISQAILDKVAQNPELISSARRFFNYYLPTAIQLAGNYRDFEKQTIKGENILTSMEKIEHALDLLKQAFQEQLNTLFSSTALELETDVSVLENILKKEGLIENDFAMLAPKKENEEQWTIKN